MGLGLDIKRAGVPGSFGPITVIDEFQQLNLFVFELLFYMIGDMPVKSIVKFIIFLASLLIKSTNYLKNVIFL